MKKVSHTLRGVAFVLVLIMTLACFAQPITVAAETEGESEVLRTQTSSAALNRLRDQTDGAFEPDDSVQIIVTLSAKPGHFRDDRDVRLYSGE